VLSAPINQVRPLMGADLIIVVFAVVVIGGMGSIMGSIITGFALVFVIGEIDVATARRIMLAAGVAMALGGLGALVLAGRLAGPRFETDT
jgi:hypothetical protein